MKQLLNRIMTGFFGAQVKTGHKNQFSSLENKIESSKKDEPLTRATACVDRSLD